MVAACSPAAAPTPTAAPPTPAAIAVPATAVPAAAPAAAPTTAAAAAPAAAKAGDQVLRYVHQVKLTHFDPSLESGYGRFMTSNVYMPPFILDDKFNLMPGTCQ